MASGLCAGMLGLCIGMEAIHGIGVVRGQVPL